MSWGGESGAHSGSPGGLLHWQSAAPFSLEKLFCRFYDLLWLWNSEQCGRKKRRGTLCHSRKASATLWTGPEPWSCCGLRVWVAALHGPLTVFQLRDKIMTHTVYPLPLLRRASLRVRTTELSHALQSRDESLGQVGALVAWCWSLPCTQHCPPPAPAPTLDMTLPPCKLLSEMLLLLCAGAEHGGAAVFVPSVRVAVVTVPLCFPSTKRVRGSHGWSHVTSLGAAQSGMTGSLVLPSSTKLHWIKPSLRLGFASRAEPCARPQPCCLLQNLAWVTAKMSAV